MRKKSHRPSCCLGIHFILSPWFAFLQIHEFSLNFHIELQLCVPQPWPSPEEPWSHSTARHSKGAPEDGHQGEPSCNFTHFCDSKPGIISNTSVIYFGLLFGASAPASRLYQWVPLGVVVSRLAASHWASLGGGGFNLLSVDCNCRLSFKSSAPCHLGF